MVSELWVRLWPVGSRDTGIGSRGPRRTRRSGWDWEKQKRETNTHETCFQRGFMTVPCDTHASYYLSLQTTKASCQGYGLLLHAWRLEPLAGVIQRAQPQRPRCALAVDTRLRMLDLQTSAAEEPAVVRIGAGDVVA